MNEDCFDRLEAELAQLTRQGAHLHPLGVRARRRQSLARRAVAVGALASVLGVSLVGEFPASASGHVGHLRAAVSVRA